MKEELKTIRRHDIELQKKFTLSFACIIFFFIGAPLGAIIRKGGIGMPLVISVILFIFYYIIDKTGYIVPIMIVHTICEELKYGASSRLAPSSTAITLIPAKNSVI